MASILQKYFVYDPSIKVGDELGGLRVVSNEEKDDGALHILTNPIAAQYWIDQGMLGKEPVGKLSGEGKKLLAQVTRGRSENLDDEDYTPTRLPKYNRQTQSGAPMYAAIAARKQKKAPKKKDKQPKKQAAAPRPAAPVV